MFVNPNDLDHGGRNLPEGLSKNQKKKLRRKRN